MDLRRYRGQRGVNQDMGRCGGERGAGSTRDLKLRGTQLLSHGPARYIYRSSSDCSSLSLNMAICGEVILIHAQLCISIKARIKQCLVHKFISDEMGQAACYAAFARGVGNMPTTRASTVLAFAICEKIRRVFPSVFV